MIIRPVTRKEFVAACLLIVLFVAPAEADSSVRLERIGGWQTGVFDRSAAEVPAFDSASKQLFTVNVAKTRIDVLDLSNPAKPEFVQFIDVSPYGKQPNSVAVRNGLVAAAVGSKVKTDPGRAIFFDAKGKFLAGVAVGPNPDMIVFTPDGRRALTANEGEPNDDYTIDPEGSVSIIDLSGGVETLADANVKHAGFASFNNNTSLRVFGPGASLAQDVEPEYIAVSPDSKTAWVSLQENNALATLDIESGRFTQVVDLGFKDHDKPGHGLDASDKDGGIHIRNWPVRGLYQPDTLAVCSIGGKLYLFMANEGDIRDYAGYKEEARAKNLKLDPKAFPNAGSLLKDNALGRLSVSRASGDTDGDGDYDALYSFGGRSFSIRTATGDLVFDSGDAFEQITAKAHPGGFNTDNNDNDSFDTRSDKKGPEPEGVAVGGIGGRFYAFIGLERPGGIVCYDVTNPASPAFVQYINPRDWTGDPESGKAGDLGPEGLLFVPADSAPGGEPLLIVTNEVSGTVSVFRIYQ